MRGIGLVAALVLLVGLAACASRRAPAPVVERGPGTQGVRSSATPAPAAKPVPVPDGYYLVKRGDTLYSIALEHGGDYREIAQWNQLDDPTRIRTGQLLRVRPPDEPAVQVGRPRGAGAIEARPLEAQAKEPAKKETAKQEPAKQEAKAPNAGSAGFIWPARGKILAGFSEPRSKGIDIEGKLGDPVVAAAPGRVTYIGSGIPGLGKLVVIKHDNGFITVYAHNRDILVKEQQNVSRGQKIAELGATDADRPKLHFQIRKGSAAVDPLPYLPAL